MILAGFMEWDFDVKIIEFFNGWIKQAPFLKEVFLKLSFLGTDTCFIIVIGALYWWFNKSIAKEVGKTAFFAMIFNNIIKGFCNRFRPFQQSPKTITAYDESVCADYIEGSGEYIEVDGVKKSVILNTNGEKCVEATSLSFPSGHSNGASSVYNGIAIQAKKTWVYIVANVLCALVMLSRMVLGAHFLTDVIVGYLTGLLFILLMFHIKKHIKNEYILYFVLLVIFGIATFTSPLYSDQPKDLFSTYGVAFGMVFGCLFEEKLVNFNNVKTWWKGLLRLVIGGILVLGIKEGGKLFYPKNLEDTSILKCYLDMIRYGLMVFVATGICPLIFKKIKFLND